MRSLRFLMVCLTAAGLCLGGRAPAAEHRIGVLAKNGPAKAVKQWGATADYLTERIAGESFVVVPLDFEQVFPAVEKGRVDFFLVNSSMFVTARVRYGAEAVATMINSRQGRPLDAFGGVIFTYVTNDAIDSLDDLRGSHFMAVKESSFGGWQMAYKELVDRGIDPKRDFASLSFGGTHDNVVYAIQGSGADAGTVRSDTLERMAAAGDIDLTEFKIIARQDHPGFPFVTSTPLYPEWPFARTAETSGELASRVAEALIAMPADSSAAKNAKVVGWTRPLDYDPVERLQESLRVGAYR